MLEDRRSYFWLIALVLLGALLGGIFGPGVANVAAATANEDDINASFKTFTRIYALVEENFAEKVGADKGIFKGAIPGMLRTLDPHSSFFDPKDYQTLREDQKGHYFGVGMTVSPRNHHPVVIAPFLGSPA